MSENKKVVGVVFEGTDKVYNYYCTDEQYESLKASFDWSEDVQDNLERMDRDGLSLFAVVLTTGREGTFMRPNFVRVVSLFEMSSDMSAYLTSGMKPIVSLLDAEVCKFISSFNRTVGEKRVKTKK